MSVQGGRLEIAVTLLFPSSLFTSKVYFILALTYNSSVYSKTALAAHRNHNISSILLCGSGRMKDKNLIALQCIVRQ